jgi:hypothetical protein
MKLFAKDNEGTSLSSSCTESSSLRLLNLLIELWMTFYELIKLWNMFFQIYNLIKN